MAKTFQEFASNILATLEGLNIRYAIGGSVASSAYGAYRSTNDIDISIEMPLSESERFIKAFTALGYYVYIDAILDAAIWHTPFNVIDAESGYKADFFLVEPTPLQVSLFERTQLVPYDAESGAAAIMYSIEDVIVYKLKYFAEGKMPKHPRDILAMLEMHHAAIDLEYISNWASETGVLEIWNEILEEHYQRMSKNK